MFFNPLFIDTNSAGEMQSAKGAKLGKAQYLFSDIIKISLSQSGSSETEATPSFNLSLINNLGSISSLFSSINSNAVKTAVDGTGDTQNGDTILTNFLQFAFVNQANPDMQQVDIKELMKDKELMLSKESLTKSLSQLLQLYRPLTQSGTEDSTQSADPEKLAAVILQSIDDKGKAILNFNNDTSQIKIELTKLNNNEKELFISTKIIPMMVSVSGDKNGNSVKKGSEPEENTAAAQAAGETPAVQNQPLMADFAAKDSNSTDIKDVQTYADGFEKIINKAVSKPVNKKSGEESSFNSAFQNGELTKAAADVVPVSKAAAEVNPAPENVKPVQKESAAEPVTAGKKENFVKPEMTGKNNMEAEPVKENSNSVQASPVKDVPAQETAVKSENNDEYKLRVVEVNSDAAPATKETKIYSMTPFEKNILKKASITYTSAEAETAKSKNVTSTDNIKNQVPTDPATDAVNTVEDAEKSMLKSNTMLFGNDSAEQGQVDEPQETLKAVTPKKDTLSDGLKTDSGAKGGKTIPADSTIQNKAEFVKTSSKDNAVIKDVTAEKKVKSGSGNSVEEKQSHTDTIKSVKTSAVEDSKAKTAELKNETSEKITVDEQKGVSDSEKSSLKQDLDSAQKDFSNSKQNSSDKKTADTRQFTVQNVADKEKVTILREESLKDLSKQTEHTKTIKTYEIIKEIKSFIEQGSKSSMTLNLVPENLGSVKINLDVVKNMVQARIDVDSENVKQFVQTNLDTLKQSLNQSGVNVSMLQVNVSSSDQKHQRSASQAKRKGGNSAKEVSYEEVDAAVNKKILGYNSYDYLA